MKLISKMNLKHELIYMCNKFHYVFNELSSTIYQLLKKKF